MGKIVQILDRNRCDEKIYCTLSSQMVRFQNTNPNTQSILKIPLHIKRNDAKMASVCRPLCTKLTSVTQHVAYVHGPVRDMNESDEPRAALACVHLLST